MKTRKKILVLLGVFLAAAVVYFMWPMSQKEENGGTASYTVMAEPSLPMVFPHMLDREMAPLFGHREEKAVTAARDSLIVLPEDRRLPVRIASAGEIVSLRYEIRSLDMENLIERTELTDWKLESDSIETVLPIQNLLDTDTEYQLAICAGLTDGSEAWYYTRILETENENVEAMLALAQDFSDKTFHYTSAQDLTMYMETSPTADNSSLGVVTLKNSFSQMTWGNLDAERISEPQLTLKELHGNLANVELNYTAAEAEEDGKIEYYMVTEAYTMKWTSQRIYMMDYERRMNQLFDGSEELYSGKRILLGISDGEELYAKKSEDGRFTVFVNLGELWSFDSSEGENVRVFAFGGSDAESLNDPRANHDRHGIEILKVEENGNIDFLVYGYMNRGIHEGWTGIGYHHYSAEENTLEEKFFIPTFESYEELREDIRLLASEGENGILYFYMNGTVYGIDLISHEYVAAAHGLDRETFAVSRDRSRIAWQDGTGRYDSEKLYVMDLNTGSKIQIGGGNAEAYRILGFVGNDLVYGVGNRGDYMMSNGRIMGLYLKSLEIVDKSMDSVMHYEKNGQYIREVQVDDSRIHITLVKNRENGFFGTGSEDTLVCNAEAVPKRTDDIGWYASEAKGRVYFVQLTKDVPTGKKLRSVSPKKLLSEKDNIIMPEQTAKEEEVRFYAYGRGRLLGIYTEFADAADAAYECMGSVAAGKNEMIWNRGNKNGAYFMRDIQSAVKKMEQYQDAFAGESLWKENVLLLEASGTKLNQILAFTGQNLPVQVNLGEGKIRYITGYDQTHVRLWNPEAGQSETLALDTAEALFEKSGNDFIACIAE